MTTTIIGREADPSGRGGAALLARAVELLDRAAEWSTALAARHRDASPSSVEATIDKIQPDLVRLLGAPSLSAEARRELSELVLELAACRAEIHQEEHARRTASLGAVSSIGAHLGTATSVSRLIGRIPPEICDIGYERCLVSMIDSGLWIAKSAYVRGDPELAREIVAAGSDTPRRIDRSLLESELVRRRIPLLVRDAQHNPHVHRALIEATGTPAYVAAPIVVGGAVVAFIHADTSSHTGSVDEFDREVLAIAADCVGMALEGALYRARLQSIRRGLEAYTSDLVDMIDGESSAPQLGGPEEQVAIMSGRPPQLGEPWPSHALTEGPERLTPRECEVLERMAAGQRNVDIAHALFITEATVKAHVKHIFRKMAVTNRAEAVSRYLLSRGRAAVDRTDDLSSPRE